MRQKSLLRNSRTRVEFLQKICSLIVTERKDEKSRYAARLHSGVETLSFENWRQDAAAFLEFNGSNNFYPVICSGNFFSAWFLSLLLTSLDRIVRACTDADIFPFCSDSLMSEFAANTCLRIYIYTCANPRAVSFKHARENSCRYVEYTKAKRERRTNNTKLATMATSIVANGISVIYLKPNEARCGIKPHSTFFHPPLLLLSLSLFVRCSTNSDVPCLWQS